MKISTHAYGQSKDEYAQGERENGRVVDVVIDGDVREAGRHH